MTDIKMRDLTEEEYEQLDGGFPENKCPFCDSKNIHITVEPWLERSDYNGIGLERECKDCLLRWREFFTFADYYLVSFEVKS